MRRIAARATGILVAALLCGGPVQAQTALQQRISVTYQGAAAGSVFQALADVLGVRLQLDGRVGGALTLDVRNVSVETVLRAACESIGCQWRIDKGTLVIERDPGARPAGQSDPLAGVSVRDVSEDIPVDIRWSDAPLASAIDALARMLGAEPAIDESLADTRISLSLSKASARTALNAICGQARCRWRLIESPKRVLRIVVAPPIAPATDIAGAPPFAPGLARAGDPGITAPRIVSAVHPRYTDAAMRARIQGAVTIECVVEPDGTVGNAHVVKSLDSTYGLDSEALAAAKLYLFQAGTKNGNPVPVVVTIDISFSLR